MKRAPGARRRPWFGPKRFGWGVSPRTWEGWVIVLGGAVVVVLLARLVQL